MAAIKIRSIKFNFLMNLLLTGSSMLFPLITFPFVSRALLSDGYGLVNWALTVASWLSLVAMLGVNRYGIREVAKVRDDFAQLKKVTCEILIVTLVSTAIVYLCFLLSLFFIPKFADNRLLLFIAGLMVLLNTIGVGWFFQGIEQYAYITVRGVAIKLAMLLGVILLVHAPKDYLLYAVLYVVAMGLANVINFLYMIKILRSGFGGSQTSFSLKSIDSSGLRKLERESAELHPVHHVKPLMSFFVIAAAVSIYTTLDTVMIGFLSTDQQVGYYTAAANVKVALVGIASALTGVLLPRASNMLAKGDESSFRKVIRVTVLLVLAVSIPLSAVFAFFGVGFITWYAGPDFAGAGTTVSIVMASVPLISLSTIFCDAVMVPLGMEKRFTQIEIAAAVFDFFGNLLLIPLYGAAGAAIATVLVEVLVAVVSFLSVRKRIWGDSANNASRG